MRKGRVHRVAGQQENAPQQTAGARAPDAQSRGTLKPRAGVKRSAAVAAADGAVKKVSRLGGAGRVLCIVGTPEQMDHRQLLLPVRLSPECYFCGYQSFYAM